MSVHVCMCVCVCMYMYACVHITVCGCMHSRVCVCAYMKGRRECVERHNTVCINCLYIICNDIYSWWPDCKVHITWCYASHVYRYALAGIAPCYVLIKIGYHYNCELYQQLLHTVLHSPTLSLSPFHILLVQFTHKTTKCTHTRGDFLTVQKGNVCASSWMDRKVVTVMSTTSQPESTNVLQRQKDGSRISVPCPMSIMDYNTYMGGVDRGDQVRGYYSCRMKCRKFYKYIFHFLLDVAITNAFILQKGYCEDTPFSSIK